MIDTSRIPSTPGIYLIRNLVTRDKYIGRANDMRARVKLHKRSLETGCCHNVKMQELADQHGAHSFTASVLEYCEIPKLPSREAERIRLLKPSLNISSGNPKRKIKDERRNTSAMRRISFWLDDDIAIELGHWAIDRGIRASDVVAKIMRKAIAARRKKLAKRPPRK